MGALSVARVMKAPVPADVRANAGKVVMGQLASWTDPLSAMTMRPLPTPTLTLPAEVDATQSAGTVTVELPQAAPAALPEAAPRVEQLPVQLPALAPVADLAAAEAITRRLAHQHYENFSVVSLLVLPRLR